MRRKTNMAMETSVYSRHFNTLKLLGAWAVDPRNPTAVSIYSAYKTIMTIVALVACVSLFVDFYHVLGDFKKMTWNMCVTALFTGGLIKNIHTVNNSSVINGLRESLHRKSVSRRTPEDERLNKSTERDWKLVRNFFYGTATAFVPLWLSSFYFSYLWGPRGIPIPLYLPFEYDLEDEFQYNLLFVVVTMGGVAGIMFVLENELAMLTILIQISREYNRLLGDLTKINALYEGGEINDGGGDAGEGGEEGRKMEVNPWLRKLKTKMLVKEYCTHQQQLIEYTKNFELCYSYSMVLQVFVMTVLVVVIAMFCIIDFGAISLNLSYQIAYVSLILLDMFLLCSWCTKIRGQCLKVGEGVYSTLWYQMSGDIRRDICMIIMRSQRPPKITSGKLMELNLRAYMIMLRNIYSWLALFHQLAFKSNQ